MKVKSATMCQHVLAVMNSPGPEDGGKVPTWDLPPLPLLGTGPPAHGCSHDSREWHLLKEASHIWAVVIGTDL